MTLPGGTEIRWRGAHQQLSAKEKAAVKNRGGF
jgi:hypothetical protein